MIQPDTLAALSNQDIEWVVLVRFELDDGPLCFSNLFEPINFEGFEYQGFGNLGDISGLTETLNLDPQWLDVKLSGVNAETLQAALAVDYFNRPAYVHLGVLGNEQGLIIGAPFLYFAGTIDNVLCNYGESSEILVSCADELADWERPKIERYSDQDQQARYPGDTGFRFTAQLDTKEIVWPAREWFVKRA